MLDKVLSFIAPHHCCGCDKIGSLLCDNCKNNINYEQKTVCIVCGRPTVGNCICRHCPAYYDRIWVVGERTGVLRRVIGLYKFERAKDAYRLIGDLLLGVLPVLPVGTVIVPIPTVSKHIRERGYDHMWLIANYVAKAQGLRCDKLLHRKTNTKQRQASAQMRRDQAKNAFEVRVKLDPSVPYLIIDDVVTTGATIEFAAKRLRKAGARQVWVAVVARQVGNW